MSAGTLRKWLTLDIQFIHTEQIHINSTKRILCINLKFKKT